MLVLPEQVTESVWSQGLETVRSSADTPFSTTEPPETMILPSTVTFCRVTLPAPTPSVI